ncbi:MAG: SDR family oxidoreductase [FCB group bacterium]|nr:SDR family oxidoreductase [FCB group bacterium]
MKNRNILRNKTALITGASSGLGVDFARGLADYGCHLILVARRENRLADLKQEIIDKHDVEVTIIPMDLLSPDAPQKLFDRIRDEGKTVDVLINNAGFGIYGEFIDTPWERIKQLIDLDIVVLVRLTKLFLGDMVKRDSGYIMQIASTGAYQPMPMYACYGAAKSFVLNFGEALNYELRNTGVSCTVVSPGPTRTEFLEVAGQKPNLYQRLTMMSGEEVAKIGIAAMLNGKSSVVTGKINTLTIWLSRWVPRRLSTASAYMLAK